MASNVAIYDDSVYFLCYQHPEGAARTRISLDRPVTRALICDLISKQDPPGGNLYSVYKHMPGPGFDQEIFVFKRLSDGSIALRFAESNEEPLVCDDDLVLYANEVNELTGNRIISASVETVATPYEKCESCLALDGYDAAGCSILRMYVTMGRYHQLELTDLTLVDGQYLCANHAQSVSTALRMIKVCAETWTGSTLIELRQSGNTTLYEMA